MEKTKIVWRNPDELTPYENNPRINDGAVDAVAASIKQFGFKVPIVVDSDGVIVTGHTRLKAAKKLGLDTVPVIVADDLTPEQVKAFRRKDGSNIEYSDNGVSVAIEGAERLPIDAKYNNPADTHYRTKSYSTCRNWQFANYFETHLKRGIGNAKTIAH